MTETTKVALARLEQRCVELEKEIAHVRTHGSDPLISLAGRMDVLSTKLDQQLAEMERFRRVVEGNGENLATRVAVQEECVAQLREALKRWTGWAAVFLTSILSSLALQVWGWLQRQEQLRQIAELRHLIR